LTLRDFPTHTIYKHLDFYWRATLGVLKQFVERTDGASRPLNSD
jgi:hypothetical protein